MTAVKKIRDAVVDMIAALEREGIGGVWAIFAEAPDVVALQSEGGYEVVLMGRAVKIRITTDAEFNVKHIDVGP
jgi:nitroreductase